MSAFPPDWGTSARAGDPVRFSIRAAAAILDAIGRIADLEGAEAIGLIGDRTAERDGAVGRALRGIAVIENDLPPRQIGARGTGDLDELAGVGAGVVIVELIDKHCCSHENSPRRNATRAGRIRFDGGRVRRAE